MSSRRVVMVSMAPPLPFSRSTAARWVHVLFKGLLERGHQVTLLCACADLAQQEEAGRLFPGSARELRIYPVESPDNWLAGKARAFLRPNSYLTGPSMRRDLAEILSGSWDILHLEETWSGWAGLPYDRRRAVLNFHNLFRVDDSGLDWAGPRALLNRCLRRFSEARLARSYPNLMALSDPLAAELRRLSPRSTVHVCPFGLDHSLYPLKPADNRTASQVVTCIGSMDWRPSLLAAKRLLGRLWPAIQSRVPAARCRVIGWRARELLRRYIGAPGVEIVENAPDIRPYFEQATLLLYAPPLGSGMKVKILEAFAFGVPVVTTSPGVEGIPARDGVHAGICEDDAGLVERALALLRDARLRERFRLEARALVESHCGPKATLDRVEEIHASVSREGWR